MYAERRREPRYVVIGMEATIDGVACTIIDISRTGVRLLRPSMMAGQPAAAELSITLPTGRRRLKHTTYVVPARLVRSTPLELVYHYTPPRPHWSAMLRLLDTFAQSALTRL